MKHQKSLNWLNEASSHRFVTRKWNVVIDKSKAVSANARDARNGIVYNTEELKSV